MNNVFDFHSNLPLLPPPHHVDGASTSSSSISAAAGRHQNPRKKRAKPPLKGVVSAETGPKIARACSECGKKFWSWKALFGHMRCHPERHWRGINPPPNHHRRPASDPVVNPLINDDDFDDYEIAACLLLLANNGTSNDTDHDHDDDDDGVVVAFECSSCKKVFRSHQALGGHRASHKNVKGCFAMTRSTSNNYTSNNINMLDFDLNLPAVKEVEDHNLGFCLMSSSPGLANLDLRLGL